MEMDKFQSLAFRSPDPAIGLVDRHINRSLWQSWLVLFDRSVRSDSLQPHGLQPASSFVHGILQAIPEWVGFHALL